MTGSPETVASGDLGRHIGRQVALYRGTWFRLRAVGPMVDGTAEVTVDEVRTHDLLGRPIPPGATTTVQVFDDEEFPVRGIPAEEAP